MSCCNRCGCQPCSCNYTVIIGGESSGGGSGITNGVNVNSAGIGVLDAFNANTLYFRGVESGSAALTAALNATNHTILLTLDISAIAAALPQATTTQAGVGETATDAEAQAKASTTVFLTPSNLAALEASTTFSGLSERATDAEAIAGASTTVVLTPSNFTAAMAANYGTTVTFADSVARNAAVPTFVGQYGAQIDSRNAYLGSATSAGSWGPLITIGGTADGTDLVTNIGLGTVGRFIFTGAGDLTLSGPTLKLANGGFLDMDGSAGFAFSSVITSNAFITNNSFGVGAAVPTSAVASTINPLDSGWTPFSNSATRRTCDCSTVTLPELAQIVDTLVTILKLPQLPTT